MSHPTLARPAGARRAAARVEAAAAVAGATLTMALLSLAALLVRAERRERERGDVPGWVLITLMTAGLVTVLWKVAGDQLEKLFSTAIASVTGPGK